MTGSMFGLPGFDGITPYSVEFKENMWGRDLTEVACNLKITQHYNNPCSAKNVELNIFRRIGTSLICGVRMMALQRKAIICPLYFT